MGQFDQGADRHIWESRLSALEEELQSEPADALPELLALVEEMADAIARGVSVPGSDELEEVELDVVIERARQLVERQEEGEEVTNDDAVQAVAELRNMAQALVWLPEADAGADMP